MKVHLESTDRIITVVGPDGEVPARVWEGTTESGIPIFVAITRVAVRADRDRRQFDAELIQFDDKPPSSESALAIPNRLIL